MSSRNNSFPKTIQSPTRKSNQYPLPERIFPETAGKKDYEIFPYYSLPSGKINNGFPSLVKWISNFNIIRVDGFIGVRWEEFRKNLNEILKHKYANINYIMVEDYMKSSAQIEDLVEPFLGEEESVWGKKCDLRLRDFFSTSCLEEIEIPENSDLTIILGTGANLVFPDAPLAYIDLPKNELQYRMRSGTISNLGRLEKKEPFKMYKHYYFIDWVVLNQEKKRLAKDIEVMIDGQFEETVNWAFMKDLRKGLHKMGSSIIRVRPWFEPGAWGGQWIKENIPGLNKNVVNYAWAFSLIVPENGLLFESDGYLLEISFDFLMNQESKSVLGKHADKFGTEFPIRFNFLDTFNGGNLSIQCHPSLSYIQEVFGENITQDESYYILDCQKEAQVYLGFQEKIDPNEFRRALEESQDKNLELDIEKYVQKHNASKHDLFLIPNGTVHSAGSGNMVLEISATPYIFTFKMYDWLRLDLNGKPRPINIEHAFNNLNFQRKGKKVEQELISNPVQIESGEGYQILHYPTHESHFYDIRRLDFDQKITRTTEDSCQVMMLVEGDEIIIQTANGENHKLSYAETFVIPAAAKNFTIINNSSSRAKVINAFLK